MSLPQLVTFINQIGHHFAHWQRELAVTMSRFNIQNHFLHGKPIPLQVEAPWEVCPDDKTIHSALPSDHFVVIVIANSTTAGEVFVRQITGVPDAMFAFSRLPLCPCPASFGGSDQGVGPKCGISLPCLSHNAFVGLGLPEMVKQSSFM